MEVLSVRSGEFKEYGFVVEGYDFSELIGTNERVTEKPSDSVLYLPGVAGLEALPIAQRISDALYGGMPVQVGTCNGYNKKLNALEYHRGSELNVAGDDVILLLARLQDVSDGVLDTSLVRAFLVEKGTGVMLYETTLHYAPCCAPGTESFRVVVVLPKGTNTERPDITPENAEDRLLWARNKWLIAHPDAAEAAGGAFIGLTGENLSV